MKAPKAFTADQVINIFSYAQGVTGADFPRAFRITREIRSLKEFKEVKGANGQKIVGIERGKDDDGKFLPDEIFLHLKPTDLPAIWGWIKERRIGDPKNPLDPGTLIALEDMATCLGQEADYATVVEDMAKEPEEKEEEKANA